MNKYLGNAFSLQMLDLSKKHSLLISPVDGFPKDCISVVGHADTATVLGVPFNRVNLKLNSGDELYVAQLTGGRLPEGCTTLPDGFKFTFVKVTID